MSKETGHSHEAEIETLKAKKEDLLLQLRRVEDRIKQLESGQENPDQEGTDSQQEAPNAEIIRRLNAEWFYKIDLGKARKGLAPDVEERLNGYVSAVQHYIVDASKSGIDPEEFNELAGKIAGIKEIMDEDYLDERSVDDTLLPGAKWESKGVQKIVKNFEDGSPAIIWRIKKSADDPYEVEIAVEIPVGAYFAGIDGRPEDCFDRQGRGGRVQKSIEPAIFRFNSKPFVHTVRLAQSFFFSDQPKMMITGDFLVKKGKLDFTPPNV